MTGFDIIVLIGVGLAASLGFLRGFVQESIQLAAWAVSLVAIHLFHDALSAALAPHVGTESGATILAFFILMGAPYVGIRLLARNLGAASRNSMLGPIDRVLGFGFGAIKGTLLVVMGFSVLVLAYDTVWGVGGRPSWITQSRTYPFINASSEALVKIIAERRKQAAEAAATGADSSGPLIGDAPATPKPHHHKPHHAPAPAAD